jgi:hypothetical protein
MQEQIRAKELEAVTSVCVVSYSCESGMTAIEVDFKNGIYLSFMREM